MSRDPFILPENKHILDQLKKRQDLLEFEPQQLYPWWIKPCKVKLLLLVDGLDFGTSDFGLSAFVSILKNDGRSYVKFEITLASRNSFVGDPLVSVKRSIPNFSFTNNTHFSTSMYDQIWLFGSQGGSNYLSNNELLAISAFMNNGGGVFATGDHGSLGKGLCSAIARVRSMRLWDNSSGQVGMNDPNRNDTNQLGHDPGSQFDDQSDDIPQPIQPKLYTSYIGSFWKETYPHPLLCSPMGRITVLPDHPHEGECVAPTNLGLTYIDGNPEYPGGISPEIIATSTVVAGNTSGGKQAVQTHNFGAICAYDGHLVNVGRVVTDATWHHFINVNLIGEITDYEGNRGTTEHPSKLNGFLSSLSGQNHFAYIKHYFVNIAVWIARPNNISCFNTRIIWQLAFQHRILEATMDDPTLNLKKISPSLLYSIGTHATDVLGKSASQCRKLRILIDLFDLIYPEIGKLINPWILDQNIDLDPPLPWIDLNPMMSLAMGAGLIAIRDNFQREGTIINEKNEDEIMEVFLSGAKRGVEIGLKSMRTELNKFTKLKIK